jgi:hypothetical protein
MCSELEDLNGALAISFMVHSVRHFKHAPIQISSWKMAAFLWVHESIFIQTTSGPAGYSTDWSQRRTASNVPWQAQD